jgi:hypothetical protein
VVWVAGTTADSGTRCRWRGGGGDVDNTRVAVTAVSMAYGTGGGWTVDGASTARTNDGRRGDCVDGWRCRGGQRGVRGGVETLHGGGGVYERGRRDGEGAQDAAGDGWGADGNDANRGRDEERRKKGRRRGGHLYPTSFVLGHRWPRY